MLILPKALESDPWGKTPKPPVMGRLRPPTLPPDEVYGGQQKSLRIRRSQVGLCVGDRCLRSVKLALLDRNTLLSGNAKRPWVPTVHSVGGGSGEAGRPPTGGVGEAPPRVGFTPARKRQKPISTKKSTTLKGV